MAIKFRKAGHAPDYIFLALIFVISVFGLVMLTSASSELGKVNFDNPYYYVEHQIIYGFGIGIAGFIAASFLYYRAYQKLALLLLVLNIILLALVFTDFGHTAGGAGRWLNIGPITFQPAEILKLTYIMYLAAWLGNTSKGRGKNFFEGFVPLAIVSAVIAGLLVAQPSTSTVAILLAAGAAVYFVGGARWKYIAIGGLLGAVALAALIFLTPYRLSRIVSFFNPAENSESTTGFHIGEALNSIGSGGVFGLGYGKSPIKAARLPASVNDSIFAIIASEFGFVGAGLLAALFCFLTLRIFWIAKNLRDRFGQYLLIGFGCIMGIQAFVNMAAISSLIPLTGVPLPFISYGGTALAVFLTMAGIITNISKYT